MVEDFWGEGRVSSHKEVKYRGSASAIQVFVRLIQRTLSISQSYRQAIHKTNLDKGPTPLDQTFTELPVSAQQANPIDH